MLLLLLLLLMVLLLLLLLQNLLLPSRCSAHYGILSMCRLCVWWWYEGRSRA